MRACTKSMHREIALHPVGARCPEEAVCYTAPGREEEIVDSKVIDEISRRAQELVANSPIEDVQKNLRALMESWFSRLNLVSREEFDVQREVLRRTREKLQQMEARVTELEARLGDD